MLGNEIPIRIRTQYSNVPVFQYSSLRLTLEREREKKGFFPSTLLGRVFHGHHAPRCKAIDLSAKAGRSGARQRQEDFGHGLQWSSLPAGTLLGHRLPPGATRHPFRGAARTLPGPPC